MPITPFHFGPGAAIHALAPRQVSFLAFCMANVLIDIEPLYFLLAGQAPLHRFFHTYAGAFLVGGATLILFVSARLFARRFWLPNLFKWQELRLLPVIAGAFLGSYSHVLLDSLMHGDMTPFAPFSHANPLLHAVSLGALHWFCVGAGIFAMLLLSVRRFWQAVHTGSSFLRRNESPSKQD